VSGGREPTIATAVTSETIHTLYFFFSSRRRHTRLQGDWSSDVCSSDLSRSPGRFKTLTGKDAPVIDYLNQQESVHQFLAGVLSRSEERRVGKECRSRWAA